LLKNGEVLAIGETISMPSEPFNPSTGSWNATGNTGTAIINPITPLFSNAEVFATVGFQSSSRSYSTNRLVSPSTDQFTLETGPCNCSGFNGAVPLSIKNRRLIPLNSRTPSSQAWTNTGNLHDSRSGESITVLPNGKSLLAGGGQHTKNESGCVILSSAELYTP
jgi:hypothetical protein